MIVAMESSDAGWIEGWVAPTDRMAVTFPSLTAIDRFLADSRYSSYRQLRQGGASSEIFVFDAVTVASWSEPIC